MSGMKPARPFAVLLGAVSVMAGTGAAAQVAGPADAGVQNQIFMEQQALTQRNLSDLAAARRGEPASVTPGQPPLSSALSARALTLGRLADEAAARLTRLTLRPRTTRQP